MHIAAISSWLKLASRFSKVKFNYESGEAYYNESVNNRVEWLLLNQLNGRGRERERRGKRRVKSRGQLTLTSNHLLWTTLMNHVTVPLLFFFFVYPFIYLLIHQAYFSSSFLMIILFPYCFVSLLIIFNRERVNILIGFEKESPQALIIDIW